MTRIFQKSVTTSGTPVQLPDLTIEDYQLLLKAKSANTGTITVGFSSAEALNSSTSHFKLKANEALQLNVKDVNEVWIDATVSGEGIEAIIG